MHAYLKPLSTIFERHANADNAIAMKAYMKGRYEFYGIKSPQRRELTREFLKIHGLPAPEERSRVLEDLWKQDQREYQYFGLDLLRKLERQLDSGDVALIEKLILTKSWWDTVDMLAGRSIGKLLLSFLEVRDKWINKWRRSEDIWLRRTALLFQLHYKADTDVELLYEIIRENLGSSEFFIKKAIGWALREYSKTDAESVIRFVKQTELAPLSQREALKWLQARRPLSEWPL